MKIICSSKTDNGIVFRQTLASQIYALLSTNGLNVRWVYSRLEAKDIPKGGLKALLANRPFDGVRAEVAGTTLTVEITSEWAGEREEADDLRFGCYDYQACRDWLFNRLCKSGIGPQAPAPIQPIKLVRSIKADLLKLPVSNPKPKKNKR